MGILELLLNLSVPMNLLKLDTRMIKPSALEYELFSPSSLLCIVHLLRSVALKHQSEL